MQHLGVAGADVWLLDLTGAAEDGWELLDAAERVEFAAITADAARRGRVATRAALRLVLGRRLGRAAATVPLGRTPAGKPVLGVPAPIDFSVSHTTRRAAIAVAPTAVGVDVEQRDPAALREAAPAFLHPRECAAVSRTAGATAGDLLAALWTGKEAVAKALGTGFRHLDPTEVEFALPHHGPPCPRHVPGLPPGRLQLTWLQPDADHVLAVALITRTSP